MGKRRYTPEKVISKLKEAEVGLAKRMMVCTASLCLRSPGSSSGAWAMVQGSAFSTFPWGALGTSSAGNTRWFW